ncbi:Lysozyme M1 [Acidipropionibacterium virtanenii]|uniref:lysozyme n=2 Tax=Acidipropionibacterium virtanenii TaxID=2057246 RepID=A0A344UQJ0_9ACTN|nr:Lysozyme M1 [Acidipropionibacterium virtanenii]
MGSQIRRYEGASSQGVQPRALAVTASVPGLDVSSHDGTVNWASRWSAGKRFVWVKATESSSYSNPYFSAQYKGSANQGFIRGAYHFALPNKSSGSAQAKYFSDNGGGWSADGRTLPGALDMEYNPYSGGVCYGLSKSQMAAWVKDFSSYYLNRWGRYPIVYTSASWWDQCVGTATSVSSVQPLWTARYASAVGTLPAGWTKHTVWQYAETPYDQNFFNGTSAALTAFARSAATTPPQQCTTTVNGYRVSGAIGCKYATAKSVLGNPVGAMVNRGDGYYQLFANGAITYSGATGAHELHGSVYSRWKSLGVSAAFTRLGYASSDGNADVLFGRGEIVWNAGRSHAYIVEGGIWQAYRKIGGSTAMGLPKSDMVAGRGGGVKKMNWFESGAITWGSGIHVVRGAIYPVWTRSGSEAGVYGGPTTDIYRSGSAMKQNFYHGYTLTYAGGRVTAQRTSTR